MYEDVRIEQIDQLVGQYLDRTDVDIASGPIGFRVGSAAVYLRLVEGPPTALRVFSPMLTNLASSSELLDELNRLNSVTSFARFFWRADTVYASIEHPAATLDMNELANACETVAALADHHDTRLLRRFGGEMTFDDPDPD